MFGREEKRKRKWEKERENFLRKKWKKIGKKKNQSCSLFLSLRFPITPLSLDFSFKNPVFVTAFSFTIQSKSLLFSLNWFEASFYCRGCGWSSDGYALNWGFELVGIWVSWRLVWQWRLQRMEYWISLWLLSLRMFFSSKGID